MPRVLACGHGIPSFPPDAGVPGRGRPQAADLQVSPESRARTRSDPAHASSNGSFTTAGKESPKIPTLTQVYELASNVGHAIEPLTHELGPNRLENLTKQILPVLSLLENTAQTCQDLFKKEQQLLYDNNGLGRSGHGPKVILQKLLRIHTKTDPLPRTSKSGSSTSKSTSSTRSSSTTPPSTSSLTSWKRSSAI